MTEPTRDVEGSSPGQPTPVAYDPASGRAPDVGVARTVVLLLVGEVDARWAAEAAVGLAGSWASGGGRVVLTDLHVDDPVLHEVTGTENVQGLVDVLVYGASIGTTARPVPGQSFYLIPAGTYEPDLGAIYTHPRWEKLVTGFADANASLVLFAPAAQPAVSAIAARADRVIMLGRPDGDAALAGLRSNGVVPDTLIVPPEGPATAAGRDAVVVEDRETLHAKEMMIPPAPVRRAPPVGEHMVTIVTVVLAAAAFAIAGFVLARQRPDLVPWARGSDPAPAATPAATAAPPVREGPSPTGAPLPYSVSGWAFMTLEAAQAHADEESARFTRAPFFVSPEEIQGVLYYKVLAGAVVDTAAASRLRLELLETGTVEPTESIIQFAPLAFDLGEFAAEDAAGARIDSLAIADVPAYAVDVPYSDGATRWQVYGGAYRDSVSAEAMRRRLADAGVESRLVARIGAPGSAGR